MDLLLTLETKARARKESGELDAALSRWKRAHEGLRRFDDVDSLFDFLRESHRASAKDLALVSLCAEATPKGSNKSIDEDAAALLSWTLLPGLVNCHQEFDRWNVLSTEDLDSELIAGLWVAAANVTTLTTNVWAYLITGARWGALGAIRRSLAWGARVELVDAISLAHLAPESTLAWHPVKVLIEAIRRGVITAEEVPVLTLPLDDACGSSSTSRVTRRQQFLVRRRFREWVNTFRDVPPADLLA